MRRSLVLACLLASTAGHGMPPEGRWSRLLDAPVFTIALNPLNPRTVYAGGLGHRLYRSYDGGQSWDTLTIDFPGGAAQFLDVFIHPQDTAVLLVGGSGFGKLVRSSDGGNSWQDVLVPEHAFILPSGASIVAHPLHPDTIVLTEYIGPGWTPPRLYRSTDGGQTWDTLSPMTEPIPNCALTVRWDSLYLVLARCDGTLFVSEDWHTWRRLAHLWLPGYPQESEIPDIVFVPQQPQLGFLAVTFLFDTTIGGRPNGGLYSTTDGGRSWQLIAFRDTSLWAVAPFWRGTELEVTVGGFTLYPDTLGRPLVPGSGILRTWRSGSRTWLAHDSAIPWLPGDTLLRRVWRLKYSPTGTLYAATELGLYAWEPELSIASPAVKTLEAVWLQAREWHLVLPWSGTLRLTTLTGQTALHCLLPAGPTTLSLSGLARGVYLAELQSPQGLSRRWRLLLP
ncbi:MAG: hypothetical protein NZ960_02835 [Candidatus Kapabacteria bacterium]|nr:hypothetical protein [Candidatus Kapabacteria bacterium]MDW8012403.1 hypothetical protein [Bacteroidota bacterium]